MGHNRDRGIMIAGIAALARDAGGGLVEVRVIQILFAESVAGGSPKFSQRRWNRSIGRK